MNNAFDIGSKVSMQNTAELSPNAITRILKSVPRFVSRVCFMVSAVTLREMSS
jgi:hypothetical protein